MDIRERVREFIRSNFYLREGISLADEMSLFDQGIIDSTGVLDVIQFVENEFDLRVSDSEVHPDNLDSIDRIASFVQRKQRRAG